MKRIFDFLLSALGDQHIRARGNFAGRNISRLEARAGLLFHGNFSLTKKNRNKVEALYNFAAL